MYPARMLSQLARQQQAEEIGGADKRRLKQRAARPAVPSGRDPARPRHLQLALLSRSQRRWTGALTGR